MDKRLWAETQPHRLLLMTTITLGTAASVIVVLQAGLLARLINLAFLHRAGIGTLSIWLVALAVGIGARAILTWGSSAAAGRLAIRIKQALRRRVVAHLIALGPAYTAGERSGELTNTVTEGIDALDPYFREYLPAVFSAILIPLIFLVVVLPIDGLTFVVMLATAPLIPFFMALIGMAAGALARSQYREMSILSAHFLDVMQGLPTLKLFNRSQYQAATIARITDQFREATLKVLRVAFLSAFTLEVLATLSVAIVAVEIGLRLLNGGISFEAALFLLILAPEYYQPLRTLGARFHSSTESKAAAERLYTILDLPLPISPAVATAPNDLTLHFENVCFSYGDHPVLNGINLDIQPGEHVAIVGASGSGKSTLASLLLCFIRPTDGRIMSGSVDLQRLDVAQWRQQIAWVGQSPHLFAVSIADNIQLGNPGATLESVIAAAKLAEIHEFVSQLPDGYDTLCGEQWANLSGGQAQRIALARAFLRDAPIFLLDEATAQLDPDTEQALTRTISALRNKTLILIAHRLYTITNADRIIVLANGQIAEQGTHTELMANGGLYRQLVEQDDANP